MLLFTLYWEYTLYLLDKYFLHKHDTNSSNSIFISIKIEYFPTNLPCSYKLSNQYTANPTNTVKQNKYIACKNLTAYTSVSGTKKAFTVKKNSYVNIYALYQNGNKKYIKVKNSAGKYGYIKIGTNKIFKDSSLLYFR